MLIELVIRLIVVMAVGPLVTECSTLRGDVNNGTSVLHLLENPQKSGLISSLYFKSNSSRSLKEVSLST